MKLKEFLSCNGFENYDIELVKKALTHTSYTSDNGFSHLESYERLEFLGDAVLKLVVSDYLYRIFPEHKEGQLTKIRSVVISDEILAKIGLKIGMDQYIILSDSEKKDGGARKTSIVACAMEALFGALYLSGVYKDLEKFIINNLKDLIFEINENKSVYNAKALLQEYTQSQSKVVPEYVVTKEAGKAHNKTFYVAVKYLDEILGEGKGKTKRAAQQEAAFFACQRLNLIEEE